MKKTHKRCPAFPLPWCKVMSLGLAQVSSRWLWQENTHLPTRGLGAGTLRERTGYDKENKRGPVHRLGTGLVVRDTTTASVMPHPANTQITLFWLTSNFYHTDLPPSLNCWLLITGPFSFNHIHFRTAWIVRAMLLKWLEKMIKCLMVCWTWFSF